MTRRRTGSPNPVGGSKYRQLGFTLIEAVMVIAVSGVVLVMVTMFIAPATNAYFATSARAQLGDQADTALRRIARDLALALPNSARVSGNGKTLELIPVSAAARYAVEGSGGVYGVNAPGFNVVGPTLKLSHASQQLAWYNLGPTVPDADAYTLSNVRMATSAAGNAATVNFAGASLATSLVAPPFRVYAIEQPVTYRCDTSTTPGTLTRYTGYGFQPVQPDPPSGGSTAVLARNVTSCQFDASNAAVAARYGLVTLKITLTSSSGESVSLYQAVHVDNLP